MERSELLFLAGGIIFLAVSLVGGAWWEFIGGDASKPVLYIGLSPFDFRVELLGSKAIGPSPLISALLMSERLLAILGSATIIAGSLLYEKTWSRRLLNIRPFTMPLAFLALILVLAVAVTPTVTSLVPQIAQSLPDLRNALVPYSSQYLTLNLYPLMHVDGVVRISITSRLTLQFWLALTAGVLCLAGMVVRRRETKLKQPPPPPPS